MKVLFYCILISLVLGPFAVLPLGLSTVNVYLLDVIILVLWIYWLIHYQSLIAYFKNYRFTSYYCAFIIVAAFSLLFSPIQMNGTEKIISFLYLLRFASYSIVFVTAKHLVKTNKLGKEAFYRHLGIVGIVSALFGWLQYVLYDDLRNLYYLGWDPHYKRIFSFHFDPNFFGLMLVLALLVLLFSSSKMAKNRIGQLFVFVTLAFTYSRSSYLALLGSITAFALMIKKYLIVLLIVLLLTLSVIFLPRPGGEGVKLERLFSVYERLESYKLGLRITSDYPLLGVGFNTMRYTKRAYGISWDYLSESHSGAGIDSSLLFVAATTGIIGLLFYLLFLFRVFRDGGKLVKVSLTAVLIHSMFLNSLFYPWVMVWMWLLVGLG